MSKHLKDHNSFSNYWQRKIEFEEYIKKKKKLYNQLFLYIDSDDFSNESLQKLINYIDIDKIQENNQEFREFLCLLSKVSKNHHRNSDFINKIENIILKLKDNIKQYFDNYDIFTIFKNNKIILFILLTNSIISINQSIVEIILEKSDKNYHIFFSPEIKSFVDYEKWSEIENESLRYNDGIFNDFEKNRQTGENESFICSLIRDDSVEEFISHITKNNISLSSQLNISVFETNSFLLKKKPTLIEYSAFYGSIQIFQYLRLNNVKLTPSLWLYVIHGKNPEMIHLLEENGVDPNDKTFEESLKESIKCHHNDIANYIKDNLLDEKIELSNLEHNYDENVLYINYFNCTPLRLAALKNNKEIILLLLSNPSIKISSNTFKNCIKLNEIKFNSSITSIDDFAFENCTSLTEIVIPQSVKSIGNFSFSKCTSLIKITIPSSVVEIGKSAFSECKSLSQITIPSSLCAIRNLTFFGCASIKQITIPSSVKSVESSSFYNCLNLEKITILSFLNAIKSYTFNYCTSLKIITIPSSVTIIEEYSFNGCSSLTEIKIPSSVTMIGSFAFGYCESLTKIVIPSNVKEIGESCFQNCTSLTEIIIPPSIDKLQSSCFENCSSLTKITIPSTVKEIGSLCFKKCSSLKQISIPKSVDSIGQYAFLECSSLEQIKINSSIKEIKSFTFYGCVSLKQIDIPSSVTKIGFNAFNECSSLEKMSIPSSINLQFTGICSNVKLIKIKF